MDAYDEDRRRIVDRLERAGWDGGAESREHPPAAMRYANGEMFLEVQQEYREPELIVEISDKSARGLTLYVAYEENLGPFLDAVVASQDEIDSANFRDHVRAWLQVCPRIYVQPDEDGEAQLLTPDW